MKAVGCSVLIKEMRTAFIYHCMGITNLSHSFLFIVFTVISKIQQVDEPMPYKKVSEYYCLIH